MRFKKENYCVYRIVCSDTGKSYVGKTDNFIRRRKQHINMLKSGKHSSTGLQTDFNQYGESSFSFEVLQTNITYGRIDECENHWINYFCAQKCGYNKVRGKHIGQRKIRTILN